MHTLTPTGDTGTVSFSAMGKNLSIHSKGGKVGSRTSPVVYWTKEEYLPLA